MRCIQPTIPNREKVMALNEHEQELLQRAKDAKLQYTKDQFESWMRGWDRPTRKPDNPELTAEFRKLLEE